MLTSEKAANAEAYKTAREKVLTDLNTALRATYGERMEASDNPASSMFVIDGFSIFIDSRQWGNTAQPAFKVGYRHSTWTRSKKDQPFPVSELAEHVEQWRMGEEMAKKRSSDGVTRRERVLAALRDAGIELSSYGSLYFPGGTVQVGSDGYTKVEFRSDGIDLARLLAVIQAAIPESKPEDNEEAE